VPGDEAGQRTNLREQTHLVYLDEAQQQYSVNTTATRYQVLMPPSVRKGARDSGNPTPFFLDARRLKNSNQYKKQQFLLPKTVTLANGKIFYR
jgi:hypothetical protein